MKIHQAETEKVEKEDEEPEIEYMPPRSVREYYPSAVLVKRFAYDQQLCLTTPRTSGMTSTSPFLKART